MGFRVQLFFEYNLKIKYLSYKWVPRYFLNFLVTYKLIVFNNNNNKQIQTNVFIWFKYVWQTIENMINILHEKYIIYTLEK